VSEKAASTPSEERDGALVCRLCGRRGQRRFTTLFGTDDGDNGYRCTSAAACERRQAADPLPESEGGEPRSDASAPPADVLNAIASVFLGDDWQRLSVHYRLAANVVWALHEAGYRIVPKPRLVIRRSQKEESS
jgi:hypothetical protein